MSKGQKSMTLIPIAMMFLVLGITFDTTKWIKYAFMISSIILCLISLILSVKEKKI